MDMPAMLMIMDFGVKDISADGEITYTMVFSDATVARRHQYPARHRRRDEILPRQRSRDDRHRTDVQPWNCQRRRNKAACRRRPATEQDHGSDERIFFQLFNPAARRSRRPWRKVGIP